MKVSVDSVLCEGHGRCYEIAPEVFSDDDRGHCLIQTEVVPADQQQAARKAEANCPEHAITISDT